MASSGLSIFRSVASRALHLRIHPRPANVGESQEILRVLSQFGEIEYFKSLKYEREPSPTTTFVIYRTEQSAALCYKEAPLRFQMGKTRPSFQDESGTADNRLLKDAEHHVHIDTSETLSNEPNPNSSGPFPFISSDNSEWGRPLTLSRPEGTQVSEESNKGNNKSPATETRLSSASLPHPPQPSTPTLFSQPRTFNKSPSPPSSSSTFLDPSSSLSPSFSDSPPTALINPTSALPAPPPREYHLPGISESSFLTKEKRSENPRLQNARLFQVTANYAHWNFRDMVERSHFHSGFLPDTQTVAHWDLVGRVPLRGLSDINWKQDRPSRLRAKDRKEEWEGKRRRKSLREVYEEGRSKVEALSV